LNKERNISTRRTIENNKTKEVQQSTRKWTITQLHILSLVNENPNGWNNTLLSTELNVSKPAVTKAVNALIENDLLISTKKAENNKEVYYDITHQGKELAVEHEKLHKIIERKYYDLFRAFSEEELDVVIRFLDAWSKLI